MFGPRQDMDLKKIVNQPTQQASTKNCLVLPQVRYHPSIQSSLDRTSVSQTHKTRTQIKTTRVQKNQADSTDQGTGPGWVQKNQADSTVQRTGPGPDRKNQADSTDQGTGPGWVQKNQADSTVQRTGPGPDLKNQADSTDQGTGPGRVQKNQADSTVERTGPGRDRKNQADSTDQGTGPGRVQRPGPSGVPLGLQVPLDSSVVKQVEVLTRGQRTNPDWFAWRKNRITASVAHRIAHSRFANGRSQTPPPSYLAAITGEGPTIQTRATSWGVQMEAEAVRRYQKLKTAAVRRPVTVQECGLFIDARRPWLAASPDGIVTDGQWRLCLEVKCPYKHRERRVEDACRDDPAFCLQIQDQDQDQDQEQKQAGRRPTKPPVYQLKTSHSYFTQVQVQLAVTGLQQADLVVFTLKETAVVPVTFDPELWEETVSKLEMFYRNAVLPLSGSADTYRPEL